MKAASFAVLLAACCALPGVEGSRRLLRVLGGVELFYTTSLSGEGSGRKVQVAIETPTAGWVGFGFRHQTARESGMGGADVVVVEFDDEDQPVVRDMYAVGNADLRDDGCAPDWEVVSHSLTDGQREVVLRRSYDVTDTNRDRPIHPDTMQMIFAHGGPAKRLAYHGLARDQYQWTIELQDGFYRAPEVAFANPDVAPVCGTPAPPATDAPVTPEPTPEPTQTEAPAAVPPTATPQTSAPRAAPTTAVPASDDDLSGGAIAGIVVGCVAGVLLLAAIGWLLLKPKTDSAPSDVNGPGGSGGDEETGRR